MELILQSCLFSTLATAIGLAAVLVMGWIHWPTAAGLSGIAIGMMIGGCMALLLRFHFRFVTSSPRPISEPKP